MGREIDERIVQMRFENGQFERGVQTSIKSVQALKKGLNFDDSIKGFEQLDKASKGLKLDAIASSVETLTSKFSWFHRTVMRQMDQLTDKAINTGKALVKSLSTDQISAGWTKYEEKTSAVQTIMAATAKQFSDTGEQMEFVNAQLDKLNWFTDETSYNFVDMVSNIGKFTSNNIALDDAVTAMQGIANWAAISGVNAQGASRAMYNLSQAISTGSLKVIDWTSLEGLNMTTAEFKEMAIQAGLAEGTLKKVGDKIVTVGKKTEVTVEGMRDTLAEGWLNKNVLMSTLNQYGRATDALNLIVSNLGENSNKTTSEVISDIDKYTAGTKTAAQISEEWGIELSVTEEILKDFQSETMQFGLKALKAAQEAKTFTDAIESVKDAVSTGWMTTFELIFGNYEQAKVFWTDLANTLYELFAESSNARNDMLREWNQKGGRILFIDTLYSLLGSVKRIMKAISDGWNRVFPPWTASRLYTLTERINDFVISLQMSGETMDKLSRTVAGLASILDIFKTVGFGALNTALKLLKALMGDASFDLLGFTANIGDNLVALKDWIKQETFLNDAIDKTIEVIVNIRNAITSFLKTVYELPIVQTILGKIKEIAIAAFGEISELIQKVRKDGIDFTSIFSKFKEIPKIGSFKDIIQWFKDIFDAVKETVKGLAEKYFPETVSAFGGLVSGIGGYIQSLEGPLGTFMGILNRIVTIFNDFLGQIGLIDVILAGTAYGSITAMKELAKAMKSFASATDIFRSLKGVFTDFNKTFAMWAKSKATANYATAILLLAGALFVLSKVDREKLWDSVAVLAALAAGILAFNFAMSKISASDFKPEKFTLLSAGIVALAAALLMIDKTKNLAISLVSLGLIVAGLAAVSVALSKWAPSVNMGAKTILSFSVSILVLVSALKKLGKIKVEELKKGVPGLVTIVLTLASAMRIMNGTVGIARGTGTAILGFAVSLHLIIAAFKSLNKLDPEVVVTGLIGVGAIFLEVGVLLRIINKISGSNLKGAGATILAFSIALNLLIPAIKGLAKLDGNLMTTAVARLALIEIVFAAVIATTKLAGQYSIQAGLMMIEMAAALAIMPIVIRALGLIKTRDVIQGTAVIVAIGLMFSQVVKSTKDVPKATVSLVLITAMLVTLGVIVMMLGSMEPASAISGAGALSVLLLSLAASLKIIGSIDVDVKAMAKVLGSMAILTGIVDLLAIIVLQLSKIENPAGVLAASVSISAMLMALSGAMFVLGKAGTIKKEAIAQLYILSGIIAVLGLVIAGISAIPGVNGGHAIAMVGVITSMLTAITACYAAVGALGKLHMTPTKAMTEKFAAFAVIVSGVGLVIAGLAQITDPKKAIATSQVLALFMTEMSAIFAGFAFLMSKIRLKKDAVVQFAIFSAVLVPIGALIAIMSNFTNPVPAIASSAALAVLLPSMAVAMGILAKMKVKLDPGQAAQFAIFATIASAMGAVVIGLSYLAQYLSVDLSTLLSVTAAISILSVALGGVVTVMAKFAGTANPSTIGAIASLSAGMAIVFGVVTALIVGLGLLVQKFDFIGDALETAPKYTMLLGEAIGGLVGGLVGGLISGLAGGVLNIIPILGQKLSDFATNMQPFFDMLSDMDDGLIKKAGLFAGVIVALTGAEFVSAVGTLASGVLTGISNFLGFESTSKVEGFRAFGEAITAFAGELGDIDAVKVKYAADAVAALASVEGSLPRIDGIFEFFIGKKDMGAFGERLGGFGKGLKDFSDSIEGINGEALSAVAPAAEALIALEKGVPRKGGALQEFLGEQDIALFGNRLAQFGLYLKLYSGLVAGLNTDAVQASADAAKILINLENGVPRDGGILQSFLGSKGFDKFGERLWTLGVGLNNYVIQTKKIQASDVEGSAAAIKILSELEHGIQTTGGVGSFLFGDNSFAKFGDNLKKFGKALVDYATTVSVIDTTKLNQVTAVVSKLLYFAPEDETLSKNFQAFGKNAVTWILLGFQSGVRDKTPGIRKEINSLMEVVKQAVVLQLNITGSKSLVMQNNGKYVVEGLIAGMKNSDAVARMEKASAGLANKINESFKSTAGIASPSIVMKENGVWLIKGVAEGITSDTSAEEAAKKKAENIISAFQTEFDRLAANVKKSSLSYQLWEANEGRFSTGASKTDKELQRKLEEMTEIEEEYKLRTQKLEAIEKKFGKDSTYYRDAENEMNETLLSLVEKRNEIEDYITSYISERTDTVSGYFEKLKNDNDKNTKREDTNYQIWEQTLGRDATELEKQQMKLEIMAGQLQAEANTVQLYRAQMIRFEKEFGQDSEAYQTAAANFFEAQVSLYKQRNEIEDYYNEITSQQKEWDAGNRERGKEYVKLITSDWVKDFQKMMGMTDDELRQWAEKETGYNIKFPVPEAPDLDKIVKSAFDEEAANNLANSVSGAVEKGFLEGLEYIANQENGSWVNPLIDYYKQADATAYDAVNGVWVNPVTFEFDETITEKTKKKAKSAGAKIGKNISDSITESLSGGSGSTFSWADKLLGGEDIDSAIETIGNKATAGYNYFIGESTEAGNQVSNGLAKGIRERANQPLSAATEIANNTSRSLRKTFKIKSPSRVTEEIGNYFVEGLVKGIQDKAPTAIEAAREVANSVSNIMSVALKVKSPSRVTAEIGKYVSLGMAKGITDNVGPVEYASEELVNKTVDMLDYAKTAIMNVLESDDDFAPQITPVLDMDELKRQARDIPSILDRQNGISTRLANVSAQAIARNRDSATSATTDRVEEKVTNIEFTQNNYSPKALNRRDIYRQTRNQISQLKGATKIR